MYKALISDFDGTLASTDKSICVKNIEAIRKMIARGYKFALCTGRMTSSALKVAGALPIKTLVGSFNGGEITDTATGKSLYTKALSADECMPLIDFAIEKDVNCQIYSGNAIFPRKVTQYTDLYSRSCECSVCRADDIRAEMERIGKTPKFLIIDERADEIFPEILKRFGGQYEIAHCHDGMIDFNPKGTNKGIVVDALCDIWGIDKKECITIGDEGNDIPMLLNAGLGVAVANAADDVKAHAGYVTEYSNDDGAVAETINRFILGE